MLRSILSHKVPVKIVKVKLAKDVKHFSVWHLLTFVLVFAGIGGYIIWHSFAATIPFPPTDPSNLTAIAVSSSRVNLSWTGSNSQGDGLRGYGIYRNGTQINIVFSSTSWSDTGLSAGTIYSYYVTALSNSGEESGPSNTVAVTTPATALVPAAPTSPTSLITNTMSSSEIDFSWGASTSTVGVAGYNIYEIGGPGDPADGDPYPIADELVGQTSGPSSTTFKLTGLESYTSYGFYVEARDTQGNLSAPSNQTIETTLDDSSDNGMFATRNRTSTSTTTWPYKSPFGDSSCMKHSGDTTPTPGCVCQKSSTVTCNGTCVVLADGTTGSCRPGNTYKDVCYDSGSNPFYCTKSATISSVQDEGGDYFAGNSLGTPIYAMGNGKILDVRTGLKPAVLGNGSFGPTWITYKLKYNGSNGVADGLNVYTAEYCNLAANAVKNVLTGKTIGRQWQAGDSVNANSVLCTMKPKSIETGWAMEDSPSSGVLAKAYKCYGQSKTSSKGGPHVPTQYGFSFSQFIYKSGGPKALPKGYKNGHYYNYIYKKDNGDILHFFPCSDITSGYKGNWY